MNIRHTPIVPKNARMSERESHGPHLTIASTCLVSGSHPSGVQQCPSTVISGAQSVNLKPKNVPPQYFMR